MVQEILVIISSPFSNPDKNDQCLIIYMQRAEGPPRHELIFRYLYMCIHTPTHRDNFLHRYIHIHIHTHMRAHRWISE